MTPDDLAFWERKLWALRQALGLASQANLFSIDLQMQIQGVPPDDRADVIEHEQAIHAERIGRVLRLCADHIAEQTRDGATLN